MAYGKDPSDAANLFKIAGIFSFIACAFGWYLLAILVLASGDIPLQIPAGDLSGFLSHKSKPGADVKSS
jgi:hypothetical protein